MYICVADVAVVEDEDDSSRFRASSRMRLAGLSKLLEPSKLLPLRGTMVGLGADEPVMESSREWNFRLVVAKASGRDESEAEGDDAVTDTV
jgi:hypothetical protein